MITCLRFIYTKVSLSLVLSIAFFSVVVISLAPGRLAFTQDLALSVVVGKLGAAGDLAILGPPSHRGGRHLGALYYWLVSLADLLSSSDIFGTLAILAVFNSLIVFPLLWGRTKLFTCGASVLLFCPAFLFVIRDPWHAHFLILFGVCLVLAALRALEDAERYLPWFLLFSSCLVLTHFSGLPLVAGLGFALIAVFIVRRKIPHPSVLLTAPTLAAVLIWIPSMLGFIFQPDNFATALLSEKASYDFFESLNLIGKLFTHFSFIDLSWPVELSGTDIFSKKIWIGAFVLLIVSGAMRSPKYLERLFLLLTPFVFYGMSLFFLSLPFHLYFIYGLIPILPFLWGFVFEEGGQVILDFLNGRRSILVLPASLFLVGALLITLIRFSETVPVLLTKPIPRYLSVAAAEQIADAIRKDAGSQPYEIISAGDVRTAEDSYRAVLGREHYSSILYADRFRELSALTKLSLSQSNLAYLVVCPRPSPKWQQRLDRRIRNKWNEEAKVELGLSVYTKSCTVTRLRRKERFPSHT